MERIEAPSRPTFASPALRALADSVPEIDHYELDGIPLFHLPSGGATMLSLSFAVGSADEPIPQRGITHLAEHLLLTGIDRALDHSNGSTGPFQVNFTMRGSPKEAAAFLKNVCDQIGHPRIGRMHEEANVLRAEANIRPAGSPPQFRSQQLRLGYQGLGVTFLPEFFLRHLDEKALREWISMHLVSANAVIWISGPLPDDLLVTLEPGEHAQRPPFEEVPELRTPTLLGEDIGGVGASFLVERSTAVQVALRALDSRLKKALRVDRGLGYIVATDYLPLSADRALASAFASCLPTSVAEVQRGVLEAIDDVASRGPSELEIGEQYERAVRDLTDPMANPLRLEHWAQDWLMGFQPDTAATVLDRMWRLSPEEVAESFRAARDSMLLVLPPSAVRPQRQWHAFPGPSPVAMGPGNQFELSTKAKKGGAFKGVKPPRLFVGKDGVALEAQGGPRYLTIRWDDAVAVIRDGPLRTVLARDGTTFYLQPEVWREGDYAAALVDRWAPRPLVIPDAPR